MSTRRRSYTSTRSTARTMCATRQRISKKSTYIGFFCLIHLFRILSIVDRLRWSCYRDRVIREPTFLLIDIFLLGRNQCTNAKRAFLSLYVYIYIYIKENLTFNAISTYTFLRIHIASFLFFPLTFSLCRSSEHVFPTCRYQTCRHCHLASYTSRLYNRQRNNSCLDRCFQIEEEERFLLPVDNVVAEK